MKLNWGHGIAIFFVIFVGTMLTVLFVSRTKNNDLVTEEYYAEELKYQDHLEKVSRSRTKNFTLEAKEVGDRFVLVFPEELKSAQSLSGQVHIYRPSNAALDIIEELALDSLGQMEFPRMRLHAGVYQVKVDFMLNGESYYLEKEVRF